MKKKTTTQKEIKKKEIKNFKGIERMTFMCYLGPNKEWDAENDGEDTENMNLFYDAFENGGKKIQRQLFVLLSDFYDMYILPNLVRQKKLTMYHGTKQVLALIIEDDTPYIHHQNKIRSTYKGINPSYCEDIENDNWYKITGGYKEYIIELFNKYVK